MAISHAQRPGSDDCAPHFAGYVSLVPETDIVKVLRDQIREVDELVKGIPAEHAGFRYASEKWSIREVIGHLADTERILSYRATCLARGEQAELPGFDENEYVRTALFDQWSLAELGAEFDALRRANVLLFEHLSGEAWRRSGVVNRNPITVPALAWIMAGHVRHHANILRERYFAMLPNTAGR